MVIRFPRFVDKDAKTIDKMYGTSVAETRRGVGDSLEHLLDPRGRQRGP